MPFCYPSRTSIMAVDRRTRPFRGIRIGPGARSHSEAPAAVVNRSRHVGRVAAATRFLRKSPPKGRAARSEKSEAGETMSDTSWREKLQDRIPEQWRDEI